MSMAIDKVRQLFSEEVVVAPYRGQAVLNMAVLDMVLLGHLKTYLATFKWQSFWLKLLWIAVNWTWTLIAFPTAQRIFLCRRRNEPFQSERSLALQRQRTEAQSKGYSFKGLFIKSNATSMRSGSPNSVTDCFIPIFFYSVSHKII